MRPGVGAYREVVLYLTPYLAPRRDGVHDVGLSRAEFLRRNGKPHVVAGLFRPGVDRRGAKIPAPAIRKRLQLRDVRHFQKAQAALEFAFDDVLTLFDRTGGAGSSWHMLRRSDPHLPAKACDERRGRAGAGIGVEDFRDAVHDVLRPPVGNGINQRIEKPLGVFSGGLLIAQVEVAGTVIDHDIAHDARISDLDEVFGLLFVVALFLHEPDISGAPDAVQDAYRGVGLPEPVGVPRPHTDRRTRHPELIRVAPVAPHGAADGFNRRHGDFSCFRVRDAFPVRLPALHGVLDAHGPFAVGAVAADDESRDLPAKRLGDARLALALAGLFAALPPAVFFKVLVGGVQGAIQRFGKPRHDAPAIPVAWVRLFERAGRVAYEAKLFG